MRRAADRLWRGSAARTAVASRARAWHSLAPAATDLPVLLPAATRLARNAAKARRGGGPPLRLTPAHGVVLLAVFAIACGVAQAQAGAGQPSVLATLWKWLPVLLRGFVFNLAISAMAMSTGTLAGLVLGYAQISQVKAVRGVAAFVTHFFRNAPWLVLLFYCMFLLPFQVRVFGITIPIPDWTKATFGLALPVMANVAEIVRGAVQSIPTAQWESAASLAFNRRQTMWMIILPQCIKRMLPPWMNLYAILTMSTVLTSIVGVAEIMTLTGRALSAENRPGLLLPFYAFVLVLFFLYCYPIARWTLRLEAKYAVDR
ncbi:MAG TPA: amino acid ABC transporter permease [Casimicrobiaceae bacterium]|jgi:polar amino acid transport system permease protein|nr:amino acid ABC transporter permease [Casimicrobiaceae bacterium]